MKKLALLAIIVILSSLVQTALADTALPPYVLLKLYGRAQRLPLDCESRSAIDLAAYWGVSIPELEFFDRLPKTDNPNTGFVGNVYDRWGLLPPNGYGVHAEPIAAMLRAYGLQAQARYGLGLDGLRAELAAGRPVMIWATPRMAAQPVETYVAADGQTVSVVRYEHTVIAVGYTEWAIYVLDAANGYRWAYNNQALLNAWDKLGQMSVIVYGNNNAPPAAAAAPPASAAISFSSPADGSTVRAPVEVRGAVQMRRFHHYEVWYADANAPSLWIWVSGPHLSPPQNAPLTEPLSGLAPGQYILRVVAFGADGQAEGQTRFTVLP